MLDVGAEELQDLTDDSILSDLDEVIPHCWHDIRIMSASTEPFKRDYITAIFDRAYEIGQVVMSKRNDPKDIVTWALNGIYNAYIKVIDDLDLMTFYTNYIKEK